MQIFLPVTIHHWLFPGTARDFFISSYLQYFFLNQSCLLIHICGIGDSSSPMPWHWYNFWGVTEGGEEVWFYCGFNLLLYDSVCVDISFMEVWGLIKDYGFMWYMLFIHHFWNKHGIVSCILGLYEVVSLFVIVAVISHVHFQMNMDSSS